MCSVTGLSLTLEKLHPAIRAVLMHPVPSTGPKKQAAVGDMGPPGAAPCLLSGYIAVCRQGQGHSPFN